MNGPIRIVPVNSIESAFLDRLALCIEERFLTSVRLERSLALTRTALNPARKQLFLSTLTSKLSRAFPDGEGIRLAITDFDLYKTSHRFVFGDGDETNRVAVVSLHRLRSQFYGEEPDANQLFQRTLKESVHQLGHALGLKHCFNARCAMYYSNSVFETDNKSPHFCEVCERRLGTRSKGRLGR